MADFVAGTSGYQYDHWRGTFYPEGLERKAWFEYYAEQFDSVEINNTFYGLPDRGTFEEWRDRAPEGFTYVLKYSRYGTHMKKLNDAGEHVGTFMEHAGPLEGLMGPILVQLPPNWRANPERLRAFLEVAPSRHRWAIEFRDPDWLQEPIYEILRRHNAALVIHDMIPDHPEVITADWTYGVTTEESAESIPIRRWLPRRAGSRTASRAAPTSMRSSTTMRMAGRSRTCAN